MGQEHTEPSSSIWKTQWKFAHVIFLSVYHSLYADFPLKSSPPKMHARLKRITEILCRNNANKMFPMKREKSTKLIDFSPRTCQINTQKY